MTARTQNPLLPGWLMLTLVVFCLAGYLTSSPVMAVSNDELQKYGFGQRLTESLDQSRQLEPPRPVSRAGIPAPVLPGITEQKEIPRPTTYQDRTFSQGTPRRYPPFEGPTDAYRGKEARQEELGFREVEDFIFNPRIIHPRLFSLSSRGLTGLGLTVSAEVAPKNFIQSRAGVQYTSFRRSFGEPLLPDQEIEQLIYPFAYSFVPARDLEISLQYSLVNEEGRNFPLIADYDTWGVMDVGGAAKYRFYNNPESKVSFALTLGMFNGIKRVVTRVGSSGIDYTGSLSFTKRIRNFGVHGEFGAKFINGLDRTNSGVPDVTHWGIGVNMQPGRKLDLVLEVTGFDWQNNGNNVDASAGMKILLGRNWLVDLQALVNLNSSIPQGYRNRVLGGLQFQF